MRDHIESEYGEGMPGIHTSKAAMDGMFLLAWNLYARGWSMERGSDQLPSYHMYASTDNRSKGMLDFEARVDRSNADRVRHSVIGAGLTTGDAEDIGLVHIDGIHMRDYATFVHEGHHALNGPTIEVAPCIAWAVPRDRTYEPQVRYCVVIRPRCAPIRYLGSVVCLEPNRFLLESLAKKREI